MSVGDVLRQVVPPLLTLYVFFLAMLRLGLREARRVPPVRGSPPPWSRLLAHVVTTLLAGYLVFLAIVVVFEHILSRDPAALREAVSGGTVFAFAVVLPGFLALSALDRLLRRPGSR